MLSLNHVAFSQDLEIQAQKERKEIQEIAASLQESIQAEIEIQKIAVSLRTFSETESDNALDIQEQKRCGSSTSLQNWIDDDVFKERFRSRSAVDFPPSCVFRQSSRYSLNSAYETNDISDSSSRPSSVASLSLSQVSLNESVSSGPPLSSSVTLLAPPPLVTPRLDAQELNKRERALSRQREAGERSRRTGKLKDQQRLKGYAEREQLNKSLKKEATSLQIELKVLKDLIRPEKDAIRPKPM